MKTTLGFIILTLCAFSTSLSFAHDGHDHGAGMAACKADMEKFCKDMKPGPDLHKCMMSHDADLSTECKAQHEKMKAHMMKEMEEVNKACSTEISTYCKEVKPGEGRIWKCLDEHKAEKYTDDCTKEMKEHSDKWHEHMGKMKEKKKEEKKSQ